MKYFKILIAFSALCTMALLYTNGRAQTSAPKTLKFGILPAVDSDATVLHYAGLVSELGGTLGRPVELVVPEDYAGVLHNLITGEVDIALLSPYMYVSISKDVQKDLIVQQRMNDDKRYRGVCVVGKKSPIKKLKNAKGKRIAYVHIGSTAGYLYPRLKMKGMGIDAESFFGEKQFAGSHQAVLEKVSAGETDIGCVSKISIAGRKDVRVVLETDIIPDDIIIATKGLSDNERAALKTFFLNAAANPKLADFLKTHGIKAYIKPDPSVYAPLTKLIAASNGEK